MRVLFSQHARARMLKRNIQAAAVEKMLLTGIELVEDYPEDQPYPSRLVLGQIGTRPIHAVIADGPADSLIVVTVYEPDIRLWDPGYKRRKQ